MIRASGRMDGRPMMLIGLSGENIARLVAGEPIMFDGGPLGFPGPVLIMYGKTEADITSQLRREGIKCPAPEKEI